MKQLIKDYQVRLSIVNEVIRDFKDTENPLELIELKTKASCYRTFIVELEREIAVVEENFKNLA